jgi:DNA polymerase-4
VGVSTNRFLAKTASNLKKPDGMEEINRNNFMQVYHKLELMDLSGIAGKNLMRLNNHGIHTVQDFYDASAYKLKNIFQSVVGNYWYLKLRGYPIENYKEVRRSFGQQYALPQPVKTLPELTPILTKLVEKMGFRLRNAGYKTQGVHLSLVYKDNTYWHMGRKTGKIIYDSRDIYKQALRLFLSSPQKEIKIVGVSCFNLVKAEKLQLELFSDVKKYENLTQMLDKINNRWGKFVISPASMLGTGENVLDRIGFGNVD